jgi:ribose 5-phosphate isomerase B
MIYLGADHRGYYLKEAIKKFLESRKIEFEDLGNLNYDKDDDYPDFAEKVAKEVQKDPENNLGILICGTGLGMGIASNRFKNVRAILALSGWLARKGKEEDKANVLCLAADITDESTAFRIVDEFLKAKFLNEERYKRRIEKIENF